MSFSRYLQGAIWDFVLVALLSVSMTYQIFNCFYVDSAIQYSVVPGICAAVECAALTALTFNKRTALFGGLAYAAVAIIALVACGAMTGDGIFVDNEANYFIVGMVVVFAPTIIFLLSRTRTGAAFLFIICAFMVAAIQFFYVKFELPWVIIAVFSAVAVLVYRNYQLSARKATTVRKFSFIPGFLAACASVGLALLASVCLWFVVIEPLNPGALDIKLITEYRALEMVPVKGVSSEYMTPNLDLTSSEVNDQSRTTDQIIESDDGTPTPANGNSSPDYQQSEDSGSYMGFNAESVVETFQSINYQAIALGFLIAALVAAGLIAVYFADRRVYRAQRLAKYQKLSPNRQSEILYLFIVDKLKIIGLGVPEGQTTLEYAKSIGDSMERLDEVTGVSFKEITGLYTAMVYGKREISDEDADLFRRYYKGFWKAARNYLGTCKYFFKAFRLG